MSTELLRLENLSKSYGSNVVNRRINWSLQQGQIHALIGENGAGKSTLMKILMGLESRSEGRIFWRGQEIHFRSAREAQKAGLAMVHQHFMQAEQMTALQHLALEESVQGPFLQRLSPLPWRRLRQKATELSKTFEMPLRWDVPIHQLSVGEQQRLEILKALAQNGELLILDEPTAVLGPSEVKAFLERLLFLKQKGKTLILITHKLKEVMSVADRVAVLRKGELVWEGPARGQTEASLAEKMVAEGETPPQSPRSSRSFPSPTPLLTFQVKGGSRRGDPTRRLGTWNFQLNRHEILGIAGVEGNGQDELVDSLFLPADFQWEEDSRILFQDENLCDLSASQIRQRGLAWIPADRLNQAAIPGLSVAANRLLGKQMSPRYQRRGKILWKSIHQDLDQSIRRFDIRPARRDLLFSAYSGGNQQKWVVARELCSQPKFICACHPTRGVDLAATGRIHEELLAMKEHAGLLLISADLDELTLLCDRLLVFYRGEVRMDVRRDSFDVARIGCAMAGLA